MHGFRIGGLKLVPKTVGELERVDSVCVTCLVGHQKVVAVVIMNNIWSPWKGCNYFDARFCARSSTSAPISS